VREERLGAITVIPFGSKLFTKPRIVRTKKQGDYQKVNPDKRKTSEIQHLKRGKRRNCRSKCRCSFRPNIALWNPKSERHAT
jgi:hypothetical protein